MPEPPCEVCVLARLHRKQARAGNHSGLDAPLAGSTRGQGMSSGILFWWLPLLF